MEILTVSPESRRVFNRLSLVLALMLGAGRLNAAELLQLTFGVYTSDKPTDMYRMFKPTLVHIEQCLSRSISKEVRIKLRVFNSYDEARKFLVAGEVDLVRFGPSSYILAKRENPDVSLLVMEEQEGERTFKGVIFTKSDSGIEGIKDLKGKSFAFGDNDSTIGRYLSQAFLVDHGIYAEDLKYEYLGRHDRVVAAVLAGKFAAGAAKESTYRKFESQGLKTLVTFDNVTKPWVARSKLDPAVAGAIRECLLKLKDEKVLESIGEKVTGFAQVDDAVYDPVRVGMQKSEDFLKGSKAGGSAANPAAN